LFLVLQVLRVLKRLDRFLELMHRTGQVGESRDSRIDTTRAWLEELEDVRPIAGRLESAFPAEANMAKPTNPNPIIDETDPVQTVNNAACAFTHLSKRLEEYAAIEQAHRKRFSGEN